MQNQFCIVMQNLLVRNHSRCVSASEGLFTALIVLGFPPHSSPKALLKTKSVSGHEE